MLRYFFGNFSGLNSAGSKTKALSYLRDAPADPGVPASLEGELNLKITFIDGKRSPDRSWRTVSAEIRGNKLKMTIHREGKSNQVSRTFLFITFLQCISDKKLQNFDSVPIYMIQSSVATFLRDFYFAPSVCD